MVSKLNQMVQIFFTLFSLVLSQAPNSFVCIDDTHFKHFITANNFVIQSCPPGMCFTRNPSIKNPCIGKTLALQIDAKENASSTNSSSSPAFTCACN